MSSKNARNGSGSVERRGALWWARITAPNKPRERLPMAGSETWTRGQAKREAAKLAASYAAGRIVFDKKARKGAARTPMGALTVRPLGDKWTSGELVETYGNVNRLRVKGGAKIDAWCVAASKVRRHGTCVGSGA